MKTKRKNLAVKTYYGGSKELVEQFETDGVKRCKKSCELFQKFEEGSSNDEEEDDDLGVGPLESDKASLFPSFMQSSLPIRALTSTETEALDKGTPGASSSTNTVTIEVASTSKVLPPHQPYNELKKKQSVQKTVPKP